VRSSVLSRFVKSEGSLPLISSSVYIIIIIIIIIRTSYNNNAPILVLKFVIIRIWKK